MCTPARDPPTDTRTSECRGASTLGYGLPWPALGLGRDDRRRDRRSDQQGRRSSTSTTSRSATGPRSRSAASRSRSRERDHGSDRALGVREVDLPALHEPDERPRPEREVRGKLLYHGTDIYGPGVDPIEVRRRIGMVFQRPNPFPKSIYDNVAYGLRILGMKDNLDDRVEQASARRDLGRGEEPAKRSASVSPAASSSGSASPGRSRSSPTSCSSTSPPRRSTRSRPRRSRT